MNLPPIQGGLKQTGFFFYVAADSVYFDRFGRPLVNSIAKNSPHGIHVHLYDPTPQQIDYCQQHHRVSLTWEVLSPDQFDSALAFWGRHDLPEPYHGRRNKMLGLKQFTDCSNLASWIRKTYYACMRFVRLPEIVAEPRRFLEIDIDGLVRGPFPTEFNNDADHDFYLYEKKKGGHLAGAILYTEKPNTLAFIRELADKIRTEIERDNIYWFLDQHSLDAVVPNYRRGLLPISYIDWHMDPASAIWSAKGKRKELEVFQKEIALYQ